MGKAKKKERKSKKSKQKICTFKHFFIPLHSLLRDKANGDPLAQLVEHNTFNVGVVGSSPTRITSGSQPKYHRASQSGGSNRIYILDFKQLAILAIPYC